MSPAAFGPSLKSARTSDDLPQPDSPTIPNASPAATSNETSSTAVERSAPEDAGSNLVTDFDVAHDEGVWRSGVFWRARRDRVVDARRRGEQRARVVVMRRAQQIANGALLHDDTVAHHCDVVRERGDDAHVVRDDGECQVAFGHELSQQHEDLRLHGHVERGRRFVRDEQLGIAREGAGDHRALAHAAGQLVRILPQASRHIRHAHLIEQARGLRRRVARAHAAMLDQWLGDLRPIVR